MEKSILDFASNSIPFKKIGEKSEEGKRSRILL
jgi:hypothetical protein